MADSLLEDEALGYETVYFASEEFIKKKESLVKLLDFYEGQLASIVHTKNQIVDQCISYAQMVYEDVRMIVKKSRVQLSGKNRPVQMIKVGIPEELDTEVRNRMTIHIDESLRILTELGKSEDISEKKWNEVMGGCHDSKRWWREGGGFLYCDFHVDFLYQGYIETKCGGGEIPCRNPK